MSSDVQKQLIFSEPISQTLKNNYMPYAMSVIVSRAIPEIDGFKPAHRKLLYTMYRMKLLGGPRAKSADVVGQTMALNPHGDQAIYETLVRLTRGNGTLLHPWVDSKGNFGRVYSRDMQYAAARYTEVRLDESARLLFDGLEKNSVDFVDNYSGTMKEPLLLPAALPAILVNSNQGIAVGLASTIPSFNLAEVCRATIALIESADADLLEVLPAPDFSTGGVLIYDREEMARIYETGRGSFRLRAVWHIDRRKGRIEIRQIPYNTTVETIMDEIAALVKKNRLRELVDVRDETDLAGLRLALEYRKSADPELLMQRLLQMTSLETSFSCNFNVLIEGRARLLGVRELLVAWLAFRRQCVRRETLHVLEEKRRIHHRLSGLALVLLDIDRAIAIIRGTAHEKDVVTNLMAGFAIDREQAEYVAEIRLRQLNREVLLKRTAELSELEQEIERLTDLAGSKRRINTVIRRQLEEIARNYGRERRTVLLDHEEAPKIEKEDLIVDYNVRVFLTRDGYLKKIPLTSLRGASSLKMKDDDVIIGQVETQNKASLFLLGNRTNAYRLNVHELPDHRPSDLGTYAANVLEMEEEEKIVLLRPLTDDYEGQLLFAFADGRALRVRFDRYQTKSPRRRLIRAYSDKSPLVAAVWLDQEKPVSLFFQNDAGRLAVVASDLIPEKKTRTAQGVQVMRLARGRHLASLTTAADWLDFKETPFQVARIPALGRPVKEKLLQSRQLTFLAEGDATE